MVIAKELPRALKPGGLFFMEIGSDQADAVHDLFLSFQDYNNLMVYNDYSGLPRVFQVRRKETENG